jgi:argininosuccinate lyase
MSTKPWYKGIESSKRVEDFTAGRDREFDRLLARYDVLGSIAHAIMLCEVGLLTKEEADSITRELRLLHTQYAQGDIHFDEGTEDIHSQVEHVLISKLGETGKKIHTGRSRNDQVLVDIKLFLRSGLVQFRDAVLELFGILLSLAQQHSAVLIPGYTHMQVAMPSSFGLWFSAYAEALVDDMEALIAAFNVTNKNPLGSAAGYGSSFAISRQRTTELLGFSAMNVSSVYAQMTRGKTEHFNSTAIAAIASTLAKLATDVCLYTSQNFGFLSLPQEYSTGSSIMPHKQNPDIFELVRARCNRLRALPNDIAMIVSNLPSGYHRDLQILKELLFPAFEDIRQCIEMCCHVLPKLTINPVAIHDERYIYMFSVDVVHELVRQGKSFRDAYRIVAEQIRDESFQVPQMPEHSHEGSIGNLHLGEIRRQMMACSTRINDKEFIQAERKLHKP